MEEKQENHSQLTQDQERDQSLHQVENEEHAQDRQESADERGKNASARILGTAVVAIGFVILLFAVAALIFYAIACLMQGDWVALILSVVVAGLLLWLLGRLVRVAANQNKLT